MGRKGGPIPLPTNVKVLRGETRRDRLNDREPKPGGGRPTAPRWLDADTRAVWRETVRELEAMQLLARADRHALAAYCVAVTTHARAAQQVAEAGVVLPGQKAELVRNPATQVLRESAALVRAYAQEFGLTPSARAAIKMPDKLGEDELERLLS